jgi:hypothetical protein
MKGRLEESNRSLSPAHGSGSVQPTPVAQQGGVSTGQARLGHGFSRVQVLQRQQAGSSAAETPLESFTRRMHRRYGVDAVAVGTEEEQAMRLARQGLPPLTTLPGWQEWDPADDPSVFDRIEEAFEQFAAELGGVGPVSRIVFYEQEYERLPTGVAVAHPEYGARMVGTELRVFHSMLTGGKLLPTGRSAGGQAPVTSPTQAESERRVVVHELGHSLQELAIGRRADPQLMDDFKREVGWRTGPGGADELYDIGAQPVVKALASGAALPAAYRITPDTWNSPKWMEQPISRYAVEEGPVEDFADSVLAYVAEPNVLMKRSNARYEFLRKRKAKLAPGLLVPPSPPGDFPLPKGDTRVA